MREAVIVSTARTPIGVAFKGALNNIKSPTLMGHAISHAVERAGVDPGAIDDVVIGSVLTAGTAGMNVARLSAMAAGLPNTVAGQTIDRQCSSGLMAIATAAKQIMVDGQTIAVAGGQENISAIQNTYLKWVGDEQDPNVIAQAEHAYMPMLMESKAAEQQGLAPLGIYRGMAVAGNAPEEMGIGPVYAIPKLLKQAGLSVSDIGLWELNEAFACQALYCRDHLGIDPAIYNVSGGAISIGHPYGMTGARQVGHALLEGKRRGVKYVVTSMCIGGGMGAAALFEVC